MRRGKLQLLALTIALALDFTSLQAQASLWTSLQWDASPLVLCPDLPLSTQPIDSAALFAISPSSILGKGLWTTHGAVRLPDSTGWWQVGTACRATQGWTDATAHAVYGWNIVETATIATTLAVQGYGATGFGWRAQAWASVAMMWQGGPHTWLGCTLGNALAVPSTPLGRALELRFGVRHEIDGVVLTADVVQHARFALAVVIAAGTAITGQVDGGIVLRSVPHSARLWTSIRLDTWQAVAMGVDVSVLGWAPQLMYAHSL